MAADENGVVENPTVFVPSKRVRKYGEPECCWHSNSPISVPRRWLGTLESDLGLKLSHSHVRRCGRKSSIRRGRRRLHKSSDSEERRIGIRIWSAIVGVVQEAVSIQAHLHVDALGDLKVLAQAHIATQKSGSAEGIAPTLPVKCVAESKTNGAELARAPSGRLTWKHAFTVQRIGERRVKAGISNWGINRGPLSRT